MTTHLLLTGGKLNIINYDEFYNDYVNAILEGVKMYIVEKRDFIFKLYFDIDYIGEEFDFVKFCIEICEIVDSSAVCCIAKAEPRRVSKGIKQGIHMVWPELDVTYVQASGIRQKILNQFGDEWHEIIDAFSSGLRMIWSYKDEEGSTAYVPWGTIQSRIFKEFENVSPSVEFLKMFSIKSKATKSEIQNMTSICHDTLQHYIRTNIKGQENTRLTGSKLSKNKRDICIFTTSKYCSNIRREHKSNHIYFLIKNGNICQKCTDADCITFTGRFYVLPKSIKDLYTINIK